MTDEQNKPVRSRDEQIVDLGARIFVGMRNHTDSMCEAQRHIDEAEARGAAEERGKIADRQEPSAWTWVHDHGDIGWRREFGIKEPHRCFDFIRDIAPLYTRPSNVAALGARVKELEAVLDGIKVYSGDTLAGPISGQGDISWFRDGVLEVFRRSRAALKREGGV